MLSGWLVALLGARYGLAQMAFVAYSLGVLLRLVVLAALCACKNSPTPAQHSENPLTRPAAVDRTPIAGVDLSALSDTQKDKFATLVDTLPSPCGKAHSLRTSLTSDATCKRAPFAAKYVAFLLSAEAAENEITKMYKTRYNAAPLPGMAKLKLDQGPRVGPVDAKVQIVEWFDYECGGCIAFAKELDAVKKEFGDRIVIHYKMYPLPSHPNSRAAARAALAAHMQGKFLAVHDRLFGAAPGHTEQALTELATNAQLDVAKFKADMAALAEARVAADIAEGDAIGVQGTPTVVFNGRMYEDPRMAKILSLWIEEELAVNP